MVAAAGAATLGAKVVLVEKKALGGDCLRYGCVPSKALIHSAKVADTIRKAGHFGIGGNRRRLICPPSCSGCKALSNTSNPTTARSADAETETVAEMDFRLAGIKH
ncbi:MAG: hypothetical protein ACXW1Z_20685 [Methylobacter sp.]